MRHLRFLPLLLITAFLLTSCNIYQLLPRADLNISLADNQSQMQVDVAIRRGTGDRTFTVNKVALQANARPGSLGADLSDFEIEYFYADGTKFETTGIGTFKGKLSMSVPSGVACNAGSVPCEVSSPDSYYTTGPTILSGAFAPIAGADAIKLYDGAKSEAGSYATITVRGIDSNGNAYSGVLTPVTINFYTTFTDPPAEPEEE
jgi:hypothetical protein